MNIEPIELADFDLVEVKSTNNCNPTPHCKKHGAMNKVDKEGIWRCISVVGYEVRVKGKSKGKKLIDGICRAGCLAKQ